VRKFAREGCSAKKEVWERTQKSHFQQNFKLIFYTTNENMKKGLEGVHVQLHPCFGKH